MLKSLDAIQKPNQTNTKKALERNRENAQIRINMHTHTHN